ncbi:MAG: DUF1570 domain-containing protein [Planctomycetota bacterium]
MRLLTVVAATQAFVPTSAPAAEFMFRARVDGRLLEGKPLHWTDTQMLLLGRDGALHEFNPKEAKDAKKTAPRFVGYESGEIKRALYEEFGDRFELTTTQHYVVVHPRGQRDLWAQRFEDLYRSFNHYFRVRGFHPQEPKFPLAAIVFRNEAEYYAHAAASGSPLQPGYLGHYDPVSNRVFLFDAVGPDGGDWSANADTIIHEATHQTAYNVGVHTRFADPPRWLVEGLATMFEAPGVWGWSKNDDRRQRINAGRLRDFKYYVAPRWQDGWLRSFVSSDKLFRSNPQAAYAIAWSLSFWLCETRPREYCSYLAKSANRSMFTEYPATRRVADFESNFGREWRLLEAKFLRYMDEL